MNDREIDRYNCFRAIRDFGAAHLDKYPAGSFAHTKFTQMAGVVTRLEALGATQVSSSGASRQSTVSKSVASNGLLAMLDGLNLAADALAPEIPGLETKFRRPRHKTDQAVLAAARAFLSDAEPLKTEFINYGMSADFLDELRNRITEFEQAISERSTHRQTGVSATAGVDEVIQEGLTLRNQLNSIVRNTLRDDRALLAAWESAHHIERRSKKKDPDTPPNPPPSASPSSDPSSGSSPES
jgi:hypothetical protein